MRRIQIYLLIFSCLVFFFFQCTHKQLIQSIDIQIDTYSDANLEGKTYEIILEKKAYSLYQSSTYFYPKMLENHAHLFIKIDSIKNTFTLQSEFYNYLSEERLRGNLFKDLDSTKIKKVLYFYVSRYEEKNSLKNNLGKKFIRVVESLDNEKILSLLHNLEDTTWQVKLNNLELNTDSLAIKARDLLPNIDSLETRYTKDSLINCIELFKNKEYLKSATHFLDIPYESFHYPRHKINISIKTNKNAHFEMNTQGQRAYLLPWNIKYSQKEHLSYNPQLSIWAGNLLATNLSENSPVAFLLGYEFDYEQGKMISFEERLIKTFVELFCSD